MTYKFVTGIFYTCYLEEGQALVLCIYIFFPSILYPIVGGDHW